MEPAPSNAAGVQAPMDASRPQHSQTPDQQPRLDDKTLRNIAERLGCSWSKLAVDELGSTMGEVQTIEKNHQNDVIRQGVDMLVTWKQAQSTSDEQQITTLCNALKNIRRADVAKFLQGVHAPRHQHSQTPGQQPCLDDKTLHEVATMLGRDWVTLAVQELGFTTIQVQTIEKNHQNDIKRQGLEMLATWKRAQSTSDEQQRTMLCTALKKIKRADIARFLNDSPQRIDGAIGTSHGVNDSTKPTVDASDQVKSADSPQRTEVSIRNIGSISGNNLIVVVANGDTCTFNITDMNVSLERQVASFLSDMIPSVATGQGYVATTSPNAKSTSLSPSPIPSTQAAGAEVFDDPLLVPLADALGEAWQTLASNLHIEDHQTASIVGSFDQVHEQARRMLTVWREGYPGIDMIGQLTKALKRMGKYDLLKVIGMEIVDEKSLLKLADELKGVWPEVAEHLGFVNDDCESIRVAYPENMKEQAWQMLKALRERHYGLVKMGELKGALKKINRYDLLKLLGEEYLQRTTIRKIARGLGESWLKLALYLQMDEVQCEAIKEYISEPWQQAEEMLVLWREDFEGYNPVEHLGRALIMMDCKNLAQELVPSQQLQPCGRCGNANPFKMRRYHSKDYEGFTRLIGLCCASCSQEWLAERFLYHPDVDNTRPWVKLGGVVLKEQLEVPIENNPVFQLKDCRTKIEYFHDISHYLKVGDHITWHRPYGIWHHAVVSGLSDEVGKVKVIHWHKPYFIITAQIVEEELDLCKQRGDLFRIDYPDEITMANTAELVIARAESQKGDIGYNLFRDNCIVLATYCKTGVAESCQLGWLYRKYTEIVQKVHSVF